MQPYSTKCTKLPGWTTTALIPKTCVLCDPLLQHIFCHLLISNYIVEPAAGRSRREFSLWEFSLETSLDDTRTKLPAPIQLLNNKWIKLSLHTITIWNFNANKKVYLNVIRIFFHDDLHLIFFPGMTIGAKCRWLLFFRILLISEWVFDPTMTECNFHQFLSVDHDGLGLFARVSWDCLFLRAIGLSWNTHFVYCLCAAPCIWSHRRR